MKIILLGLTALLACSCATSKYGLSKSAWLNLTPTENKGVKSTVSTSLYFTIDSTVDIYNTVMVDSTLAVPQTMMAKGSYNVLERRGNSPSWR